MTTERYWMKKTCELCPFSRSKTLWLHPRRAEDFAYMAQNRFSSFPCHKTASLIEDERDGSSAYYANESSFHCHGFATLQFSENGEPDGFVADGDGFTEVWEMIDHHTDHWCAERGITVDDLDDEDEEFAA